VAGDALFPAIDPAVWHEIARSEQELGAADEIPFAFVTYQRIVDAAIRRPSAA